MRPSRTLALFALSTALAASSPAAAEEVPPDDDAGASTLDEPSDLAVIDTAPKVSYGVGLRSRYVFVPRGMIELFLEEVPSGVGSVGFGIEATRRKGDFEITVGLEYENLAPEDGFYREKGAGDVSTKTDFTEFDGLGWVTIDAAFVFHHPLTDKLAFRYGGGLGLGIVTGEVRQTDALCSSEDIQNDCMANPNGAQVNDPADLPPVFPVVSLLAGLQFRATEQISINLEAGLRTLFYTGLGATYYF
jgi:hypothetical protein